MKKLLFFYGIFLILNLMACAGKQQSDQKILEETTAQHDHGAATASGEGQQKKAMSPRTSAMANIGDVHVHIDYSSPSVRGRTIWGGLVAYDQVWVTGAHKATAIDFSKDVRINGQLIPAGTYGFFTIPGREEWVVILNKNHEQHLADDYDEALDVLRFKVTPEQLSQPVEALTYEVKPAAGGKGAVSIMWDRIKISFAVEATE